MAFATHNTTNAGGLPDNYVSSLLSDRGDTLWAGTWIAGVARFTGDKSTAVPGAPARS